MRTRAPNTAVPLFEPMEPRTLLSASGGIHAAAKRGRWTRHASAEPRSYLVAFYGLGGAGFGNGWLAQIAKDAGNATGSSVHLYQETDGDRAVRDFFAFVDANGDHVLSAQEIGGVTVRAVGYSFGGIQASEFTRSLTQTRHPILGYKLATYVPVQSLVTIDPVNSTPFKHTDGPVGNVLNFYNYYQVNPFSSSMTLTDRSGNATGQISLSDAPLNPVGGELPTAAVNSQQTLVDSGDWGNNATTLYYDRRHYGTVKGADVNHTTMPFFVYPYAEQDLTT